MNPPAVLTTRRQNKDGLEFVFLRPRPELPEHELLRALGVAGKRPLRPAVMKQIQQMATDLLPQTQPRMVLGLGGVRTVDALLPEYTTVHRYLETAAHAALLAGTAGMPPAPANLAGDPLWVYVENAVSIALVRRLFVWAREFLKTRWSVWEPGEPVTPGNCGIPLKMQRQLLEQLPLKEIDIHYDTERDLLMPLVSVSGLIGIGHYQPVDGDACIRCPSRDCPLRESEFDARKFQELTWYCNQPRASGDLNAV